MLVLTRWWSDLPEKAFETAEFTITTTTKTTTTTKQNNIVHKIKYARQLKKATVKQ